MKQSEIATINMQIDTEEVEISAEEVSKALTGLKEIAEIICTKISDTFSDAALGFVRDIRILGITPFADLRMISVPEIPHLAQGAVLPANKPFLAVVGDQKHGTNVEAPLATIQEAVALVMQDQFSGMMAGFEASVGVQKQILQAVLGIEIGDSTIGQAAARYNRKMAVIQGGM